MKKRIGDLYYWTYVIPKEKELISEEKRYYFGRNRLEKELYDEVKNLVKNDNLAHIITFKKKDYTVEDFNAKLRSETFQTLKDIDVMAFDEFNQTHINKEDIDWHTMINKNIISKSDKIFEAMGWTEPQHPAFASKIGQNPSEDAPGEDLNANIDKGPSSKEGQ